MTPVMELSNESELASEEATEHATNGHATNPLVPESALDEVGTELGNLSGQAESDVAASDDADASPAITDDPTAKPAKKTAEQKALDKATKHYLERKRNAEENLSNCVLHRRDCEAALKGAKGSEKAAAELLESVLARGPEQLPLFDKPAATASDASATDAADAKTAPAPAVDPDAWKSAPLSALGLPPSLEEKLTSEGMDTIGRLEQRRADISQGKEKWPKGIGPAKVTAIEDAVVGWLTENQHAAGQVDEQPAGDVPADAAEPAAELTDAELDQLLIDRAKALNTGDEDCLEPAGETDAEWDSGVSAFDRGLKLTDCPYTAGTEQDDWLKGWISAKELKSGEIVDGDLGDL